MDNGWMHGWMDGVFHISSFTNLIGLNIHLQILVAVSFYYICGWSIWHIYKGYSVFPKGCISIDDSSGASLPATVSINLFCNRFRGNISFFTVLYHHIMRSLDHNIYCSCPLRHVL